MTQPSPLATVRSEPRSPMAGYPYPCPFSDRDHDGIATIAVAGRLSSRAFDINTDGIIARKSHGQHSGRKERGRSSGTGGEEEERLGAE